jgi:hypothetical protein
LALSRHEVVSIEMGSPLVITIALSTTAVTGALTALVMLAERIAVFRPRITRERKEELLRAKQIDREAARLESDRADAIARKLARGWNTPRPISIDFFDRDSDDNDLEEA